MASRRPLSDYVKIVVVFEPRADGGLRAYSDDVPGFVLSHSDPVAVLADVKSALEGILSHMYGTTVIVEELRSLREELSHAKEIQRTPLRMHAASRQGAFEHRRMVANALGISLYSTN